MGLKNKKPLSSFSQTAASVFTIPLLIVIFFSPFLVTFSLAQEFNDRYPSLTGIHIFPGVLPTDVGTKSFPGILGSIFTLVFKPLATALSWVGILDTVDGFAKGTIGMVLAGEKSKGLWNSKTRRCELGKWEGVKGNRLAVYEAMEKMVIEGGRGK